MANWTPDAMFGKLFRLLARYSAPGSHVDAPMEWGDQGTLDERLGPYVQDLRVQRRVVGFRALSATDWVEFMRTYFGPAIEAFGYSKSPDLQAALTEELTALIREYNCAENGTVLAKGEYLEVVGTRRG